MANHRCTRCGATVSSSNSICTGCALRSSSTSSTKSSSSSSSGRSVQEEMAARRAEQREKREEYKKWYATLTPAQRRRHEIYLNIKTAIICAIMIACVIAAGVFIDNRTGFFSNIGTNIGDTVAGWFGNETAAQATEMRKIRKADWYDNEEIPESELKVKKAAIEAFIASGASYRMKGEFQFGYASGTNTQSSFTTAVEMSYNAELDVYRFVFKNKNTSGHNVLENPKTHGLHIQDGTYYIVKENGKTYVLSDVGGERKSTEAAGNVYSFLRWHMMDNIIEPDYLLDKSPDENNHNVLIREHGNYFHRYYPDRGAFLKHTFKLWTYKDMPVKYQQIGEMDNSDVWFNIQADYFYDKIPNDKPSVADWR